MMNERHWKQMVEEGKEEEENETKRKKRNE